MNEGSSSLAILTEGLQIFNWLKLFVKFHFQVFLFLQNFGSQDFKSQHFCSHFPPSLLLEDVDYAYPFLPLHLQVQDLLHMLQLLLSSITVHFDPPAQHLTQFLLPLNLQFHYY